MTTLTDADVEQIALDWLKATDWTAWNQLQICKAELPALFSMDGRELALDKVFCERLWRSVTYEDIYLKQYDPVRRLQVGLTAYFAIYNHGWVGEGTSCLNGYFFPKPPVKPDVIVSHHPAFSVLPR